jgi:hypothetical protein
MRGVVDAMHGVPNPIHEVLDAMDGVISGFTVK